ncbi:MAG: hypothetical protein ACYCVB_11890 [Bacilli bacterium]
MGRQTWGEFAAYFSASDGGDRIMTGYMLRWQWMMLKRQLFSMEMMPLLIFNFIFQAAIIVFAIISRNQLAQNVMQVILFLAVFQLAQTANAFGQGIAVASSGLFGIAPIGHRSKIAMALLPLIWLSLFSALPFSISLGVVVLLDHASTIGALWFGLVLFLASLFFYMGGGAGAAALASAVLPARLKPHAGILILPLFFPLPLVFPILEKRAPWLITNLGTGLIHIAFAPGRFTAAVGVLLGLGAIGLLLFVLPLSSLFEGMTNQVIVTPAVSSKQHKRSATPDGVWRLFLWQEWVTTKRSRGMYLLIPLVLLCFFSLLPGQVSNWGWAFLGGQFGGQIWGIFGLKGKSTLFGAPLHLCSYWWRRLTILALEIVLVGFVYFLAEALFRARVEPVMLLADGLLALFGASAASLAALLLGQSFTSEAQSADKRMKIWRVIAVRGIIPMILNLGLIGLAIFNQRQPMYGMWVDGVLSAVLIATGIAYLRRSRKMMYVL